MLDDLVGNIIEKLKNTGLYDNTIFVFSSDNGGMSSAQVGNYPYRGVSFDNIVMSSVLFSNVVMMPFPPTCMLCLAAWCINLVQLGV